MLAFCSFQKGAMLPVIPDLSFRIIITAEPLRVSGDCIQLIEAGTGKYVLLAFCAEKLLLEFRIKVLEALQLRRHQDQDRDLRLQKWGMRAFRY